MPQYPVPPWPGGKIPPRGYGDRRTRLGAHNRRFARLPLVSADADGVITVLRGDPALAVELAALEQSKVLTEVDAVGEPHYVVRNRMGRVWLMHATRLVLVGLLEHRLWSHPYTPALDLAAANSIEEAKAALEAERQRLDDLAADGWELVACDGFQLLVDTTRPYEQLSARELP